MDATAFLLGGAVGIGSAMLTLLSDWVKGYFERQRHIDDRRAAFQPGTALVLQEILFDITKVNGKELSLLIRNYSGTGRWDRAPSSNELYQRSQNLLILSYVLLSRIDSGQIRDSVERYLQDAARTPIPMSMDEAFACANDLLDRQRAINEELGRLIRDTWPGSN